MAQNVQALLYTDSLCYNTQLVNVFKMLKALHKKPKDASYIESLPPDLWLQFEVILSVCRHFIYKCKFVFRLCIPVSFPNGTVLLKLKNASKIRRISFFVYVPKFERNFETCQLKFRRISLAFLLSSTVR